MTHTGILQFKEDYPATGNGYFYGFITLNATIILLQRSSRRTGTVYII